MVPLPAPSKEQQDSVCAVQHLKGGKTTSGGAQHAALAGHAGADGATADGIDAGSCALRACRTPDCAAPRPEGVSGAGTSWLRAAVPLPAALFLRAAVPLPAALAVPGALSLRAAPSLRGCFAGRGCTSSSSSFPDSVAVLVPPECSCAASCPGKPLVEDVAQHQCLMLMHRLQAQLQHMLSAPAAGALACCVCSSSAFLQAISITNALRFNVHEIKPSLLWQARKARKVLCARLFVNEERDLLSELSKTGAV